MFMNTCCPLVTVAADELDVEGVADPDTADRTLSGLAEATSIGVEDPDCAVVEPLVDDTVDVVLAVAGVNVLVDDAVGVVLAVAGVDVLVDDAVGVAPDVAGVGGARRRMNIAKLTISEEKSDAGLALFVASVKLVVSSGVGLNAHPDVVFRSFGKSSLVTPISTL
jgi:hypothetical protein